MSLKSPTGLLSEAWRLYKTKWKTFLGIVIAPILLMCLAFLIFGAGILGIGLLESFIPSFSVVNIAIYLVGFVLLLALFLYNVLCQTKNYLAKQDLKNVSSKNLFLTERLCFVRNYQKKTLANADEGNAKIVEFCFRCGNFTKVN